MGGNRRHFQSALRGGRDDRIQPTRHNHDNPPVVISWHLDYLWIG